MNRVIAYIDGFNLYFGMREVYQRKYLWLDIEKLVSMLTLRGDELLAVKYFTSSVKATKGDPNKSRRQNIYLDALRTTTVNIIYGEYQLTSVKCKNCSYQITKCPDCGKNIETYKEKKTDVNIATSMLMDAYQNQCDKSMLISGDRDLSPPIDALLANFQNHEVIVVFPPARKSKHLQKIAVHTLKIKEKHLAFCQLPDSIETESGYVLKRPKKWC